MVKYTLHWSKQAKADLREIFEYIKNANSRERAMYVIGGIRNEAKGITNCPTKHLKEQFIPNGTVRYAVKWRYKILFTIGENHINIVSVFHTAQDPNKLIDLKFNII
ncbi:MAG: type II toxin-antitoxin system RelE/ParE family toxin [Bacteroidetes bacterium]|nr:type II toxin-antitoxin system RelE/ParE family toxin [Bacteroidota bacterium]